MMARQSGKDQLSAILEAFLLFIHREGFIIKAAPTFSTQTLTSRRRLMQMLDNPSCKPRGGPATPKAARVGDDCALHQ
jgi:hypothetical protein